MSENKSSYFSLIVDLPKSQYKYEKIQDQVDLVFSAMKVSNIWYKFKGTEDLIYYFKTEDRRRKGQLIKHCQQIFDSDLDYQVEALTKMTFDQSLTRTRLNTNYKNQYNAQPFHEYQAEDIAIFNDSKNWHSWQKEVYEMIFNKDGSFKKPDNRHIISLIDFEGNSGKSSYFKFLYFKQPDRIARMGYGSASQLRTSAVNIGPKDFYIIDLARAKSVNDKEQDLLSALEDIKNGFVSSAMYGSGGTLMMEPPHIIVSSNYLLNYNLLSSDRWQVYEITKSNTLKKKDPNKLAKKLSSRSDKVKKL